MMRGSFLATGRFPEYVLGRSFCTLLVCLGLLFGCSGNDQTADSAPTDDRTAPTAAILFPGTSALVTSTQITVRGTARDQSVIRRVAVNGVAAVTTDGFATWAAQISLSSGENEVVVSTEDERGNSEARAAVAMIIVTPEPIGSLSLGSGPPLGPFARGIAVETAGTLVVTTVNGLDAKILRVSPLTGDRTLVTERFLSFLEFSPVDIAVMANGTLVEAAGGAIMLGIAGFIRIIDALTGGVIGSYPCGWAEFNALAVESSGTVVVTAGTIIPPSSLESRTIFRIDPVAGACATVTDAATGHGPVLRGAAALAVEDAETLVVLDTALNAVVRVHPTTGDRTIISDPTTGGGPAFRHLRSISIERTGSLVVVDSDRQAVLRVDPVTGDRTIVSDATTGSGPAFVNMIDIAVEPTGMLVALDAGLNGVLRVDFESGDRALISK